jgi:hypothetical protein
MNPRGLAALSEILDMLVVGGCINGVGIARDAAGRGLSVRLVEIAISLAPPLRLRASRPWRAALPRAWGVPNRPYLHPEDVDIALDIDRYDFAVRVEFENGLPVARTERSA